MPDATLAAAALPWDQILQQGGLAVALALSVAANAWQAARCAKLERRGQSQTEMVVAALRDSTTTVARNNDLLADLAARAV